MPAADFTTEPNAVDAVGNALDLSGRTVRTVLDGLDELDGIPGLRGLPRLDELDEIQSRILWLATRIVDAANHDRATGDGVKVGGHQASSASLVTAMTALYFHHLGPDDKVSVKPHASPVF